MFDHIDFVFIDGDTSQLPWLPGCAKFAFLFSMCKKTNKTLFAAGFGMQLLVYFCATSFRHLRVINPKGDLL